MISIKFYETSIIRYFLEHNQKAFNKSTFKFRWIMVAEPPPPPIFGGDLKISGQNNWGGTKFLGGPMNPNDVMVVVLKDILLC